MSCKEDATACQLQEFYDKNGDLGFATTSSGNPALNQTASLTAGKDGPILLSDWELIDNLQSFDRERIPERVVHAKGSGAFGYFECTHDITHLTIAKPFDKVGKKTPIAARFSTVAGGQGSADTVRDPRGFAVKFYTEDGNWDLTGNNTPIFFMRDPMLFPLFIHSQKMNPQTGVRSWDQFWDWIGLRPESTHQVMFLFSDRGIPKGYRYMHGFGSHTFSFINKARELNYVKFHFKTDQGIENIPPAEAQELAGADADYARRDLYNAIKNGDNPSWTLYVQVMPESDVEEVSKRYDPFDVTKVWPHGDYPLQEVGKMVLNRNATNFFAEIEQLAFTPSSLIPGVGASPDRMLQGRLFSYGDTHLHRLGKNYNQLPVNCPYRVRNTQRDGAATIDNQGGAPNYIPNSFGGPNNDSRYKKYYYYQYVQGQSGRYDTRDNDNYSQPRIFWTKVLNDETRKHLVDNIVSTLKFAQEPIQNNVVKNFAAVHADFGKMLTQGLKDTKITI